MLAPFFAPPCILLSIASPNIDRFSKLFYRLIQLGTWCSLILTRRLTPWVTVTGWMSFVCEGSVLMGYLSSLSQQVCIQPAILWVLRCGHCEYFLASEANITSRVFFSATVLNDESCMEVCCTQFLSSASIQDRGDGKWSAPQWTVLDLSLWIPDVLNGEFVCGWFSWLSTSSSTVVTFSSVHCRAFGWCFLFPAATLIMYQFFLVFSPEIQPVACVNRDL